MFRIRRIYDDILPVNQAAIRDVKQIFAEQFPAANRQDIDKLEEKLRNPYPPQFLTILHVAEKRGRLLGFAILLHEPVIGFCYLDFLAASKGVTGRGVGAALYEHVRSEAVGLKAKGLFFEALPDDPDRCADPTVRTQNAARLKFYERYGARPIVGTAYETPVPGGSADNLPHLLYDNLDRGQPLKASFLRQVVRAVLERKYRDICPPYYVENVVRSIKDPVRLRPPRYVSPTPAHRIAAPPVPERVALTVNDKHDIHHIRERGYVEAPVRIKAILSELVPSGLMQPTDVKHYPLRHILSVHDRGFVEYLQRACELAPENKSVYPYVFPIRNATRPPREWSVRAGYYCIDTFTPIHRNAYRAALRAVDCTLTAADEILHGRTIAYSLVRPPGHHAERRVFGGFCYFNNAAVAAHYLSQYGKVAIVDIDYHHGNGQQDIFYDRRDVLTVSLHGDPAFAYPYFTGFADERGQGEGEGFNLNMPLPESLDGTGYRRALAKALAVVQNFRPAFLIVALGFDPAKGDPTGTWTLRPKDFEHNGQMLAELGLPTLVVQEGGYRTRALGINARHFFQGLVGRLHTRRK